MLAGEARRERFAEESFQPRALLVDNVRVLGGHVGEIVAVVINAIEFPLRIGS